jgi:hypothetical protein
MQWLPSGRARLPRFPEIEGFGAAPPRAVAVRMRRRAVVGLELLGVAFMLTLLLAAAVLA